MCRAGEVLKPGKPHTPLPASAGEDSIARLDALRNAKGELRTADIRKAMQKSMQRDAAVFRTQETLEEGCRNIDDVVSSFEKVKVSLCWDTPACGVLLLLSLFASWRCCCCLHAVATVLVNTHR